MAPYILNACNSIHLIDLAQTVLLLHQALKVGLRHFGLAKGGRVLFVGTKRQVAQDIAEAAKPLRAAFRQFALALGGTLTNWKH